MGDYEGLIILIVLIFGWIPVLFLSQCLWTICCGEESNQEGAMHDLNQMLRRHTNQLDTRWEGTPCVSRQQHVIQIVDSIAIPTQIVCEID